MTALSTLQHPSTLQHFRGSVRRLIQATFPALRLRTPFLAPQHSLGDGGSAITTSHIWVMEPEPIWGRSMRRIFCNKSRLVTLVTLHRPICLRHHAVAIGDFIFLGCAALFMMVMTAVTGIFENITANCPAATPYQTYSETLLTPRHFPTPKGYRILTFSVP